MANHSEHVEPGDPRYDGFRITRLWVLTGVDPDDNQEGVLSISRVAAIRHELMPGMAVASDERRADHLRDFARELAEEFPAVAGSLHLRRFELVDTETFEGEQAT